VEETDQIFEVALEGLEYYQNYFGSSLKMAITYSHFLWMFFLITRLICKTRLSPRHYSFVMFDVFTSISIVATAVLIIGTSTSTFHIQFSANIFLCSSRFAIAVHFVLLIAKCAALGHLSRCGFVVAAGCPNSEKILFSPCADSFYCWLGNWMSCKFPGSLHLSIILIF
jgi:hypothetical protein